MIKLMKYVCYHKTSIHFSLSRLLSSRSSNHAGSRGSKNDYYSAAPQGMSFFGHVTSLLQSTLDRAYRNLLKMVPAIRFPLRYFFSAACVACACREAACGSSVWHLCKHIEEINNHNKGQDKEKCVCVRVCSSLERAKDRSDLTPDVHLDGHPSLLAAYKHTHTHTHTLSAVRMLRIPFHYIWGRRWVWPSGWTLMERCRRTLFFQPLSVSEPAAWTCSPAVLQSISLKA